MVVWPFQMFDFNHIFRNIILNIKVSTFLLSSFLIILCNLVYRWISIYSSSH
jgi:hypothetical protein